MQGLNQVVGYKWKAINWVEKLRWHTIFLSLFYFPHQPTLNTDNMSKPIDDLILEMVDNGGSSSNQRSDESDGVDEYGPDLYKDEEDRRRYWKSPSWTWRTGWAKREFLYSLLSLPEVERERILSERSEERQRNLERLEVRKLLNDGRREDTTRRTWWKKTEFYICLPD